MVHTGWVQAQLATAHFNMAQHKQAEMAFRRCRPVLKFSVKDLKALSYVKGLKLWRSRSRQRWPSAAAGPSLILLYALCEALRTRYMRPYPLYEALSWRYTRPEVCAV
jgi:hypothetical protein